MEHPFRDLVINGDGIHEHVYHVISEYLITQHISGKDSLKVSEDLYRNAVSYWTRHHVALFKAELLLWKASHMEISSRRVITIRDAMNILHQHLEHIQLKRVVRLLYMIKEYINAVKITTAVIEENSKNQDIDSTNIFAELLTLVDHIQTIIDKDQDPKGTAGFVFDFSNLTKKEISELQKNIITQLMNCKNELLHFAIFRWFLNNHMEKSMMDLKSPYLENFLVLVNNFQSLDSIKHFGSKTSDGFSTFQSGIVPDSAIFTCKFLLKQKEYDKCISFMSPIFNSIELYDSKKQIMPLSHRRVILEIGLECAIEATNSPNLQKIDLAHYNSIVQKMLDCKEVISLTEFGAIELRKKMDAVGNNAKNLNEPLFELTHHLVHLIIFQNQAIIVI